MSLFRGLRVAWRVQASARRDMQGTRVQGEALLSAWSKGGYLSVVSGGFGVERRFAVLVYLAGALIYILIVDAKATGDYDWVALAILTAASLACGWLGRSWPTALLSFVLIPLAVPFGYPDESTIREPLPTVFGVALVVPPSAALILVGVWLHRAWSRRRERHAPAAQH